MTTHSTMPVAKVHPTAVDVAKRIKNYLQQQFAQGINRVILYGSHARGTATADSDIDILVVVNSPLCPATVRESLSDLLYEILQEDAELVSVVVVEKQRFESRATPFLHNVHREGVEV